MSLNIDEILNDYDEKMDMHIIKNRLANLFPNKNLSNREPEILDKVKSIPENINETTSLFTNDIISNKSNYIYENINVDDNENCNCNCNLINNLDNANNENNENYKYDEFKIEDYLSCIEEDVVELKKIKEKGENQINSKKFNCILEQSKVENNKEVNIDEKIFGVNKEKEEKIEIEKKYNSDINTNTINNSNANINTNIFKIYNDKVFSVISEKDKKFGYFMFILKENENEIKDIFNTRKLLFISNTENLICGYDLIELDICNKNIINSDSIYFQIHATANSNTTLPSKQYWKVTNYNTTSLKVDEEFKFPQVLIGENLISYEISDLEKCKLTVLIKGYNSLENHKPKKERKTECINVKFGFISYKNLSKSIYEEKSKPNDKVMNEVNNITEENKCDYNLDFLDELESNSLSYNENNDLNIINNFKGKTEKIQSKLKKKIILDELSYSEGGLLLDSNNKSEINSSFKINNKTNNLNCRELNDLNTNSNYILKDNPNPIKNNDKMDENDKKININFNMSFNININKFKPSCNLINSSINYKDSNKKNYNDSLLNNNTNNSNFNSNSFLNKKIKLKSNSNINDNNSDNDSKSNLSDCEVVNKKENKDNKNVIDEKSKRPFFSNIFKNFDKEDDNDDEDIDAENDKFITQIEEELSENYLLGLIDENEKIFKKKEKRKKYTLKKNINKWINEEIKECSVCYEDIKNIAKLNCCIHLFCTKCIMSWVKLNNYCPICRGIINTIKYQKENIDRFFTKIIKKKNRLAEIIEEDNFYDLIAEERAVMDNEENNNLHNNLNIHSNQQNEQLDNSGIDIDNISNFALEYDN